MTFALVGSLGAPVQSASGGAVSGLAYGQPPAAGNQLLCWWTVEGATTTPATPAGWTALAGRAGGAVTQAKMFSKVAAGNDAVPTFGAITSGIQTVQLGEFSGNSSVITADQNGSAVPGSLTSPQTATMTSADIRPGELVAYCCSVVHSAPVTDTASVTVNGAPGHDTNNNATSDVNHYNFGWAIAGSNGSPDVTQLSFNATSMTTWVIESYSFQLGGSPASRPVQLPRSLGPAAVGPTFFAPTAQQQPPTGLLLAWYAADQIAVGVASGTPIASWPDLSGNSFAAVQATGANQPVLYNNSLNGLPTVLFSGTTWLAAAITSTGQPVTIFAVIQGSASAARYCGISTNIRAGFTASAPSNFAGLNLTASAMPATSWKQITSVIAGNDSLIRANGAQVVAGPLGTNAAAATFGVGANGDGSQAWVGSIAELIVYRGALSTAQIQAVESYLQTKWFAATAQPSKISLLPRQRGPQAVGPTFFAALYVPWTAPIPYLYPPPTAQAATQATATVTAPVLIAPTASAVTQAIVPVAAPNQIAPSAGAATAATATVTTPMVLAPSASSATAATAQTAATTFLSPASTAATQATCSVVIPSPGVLIIPQAACTTQAFADVEFVPLSVGRRQRIHAVYVRI